MASATRPHARPRIALTVGDPAGVGPELVLDVLGRRELTDRAELRVLGPAALRPAELPRGVAWTATEGPETWRLGEVQADCGRAALAALAEGARLAQAGRVEALVTAPVSKEALHLAGERVEGQTELLARWAGAERVQMMVLTGALRVMLLTRHLSLRAALEAITFERVLDHLLLLDETLRGFGIAAPRVALAGLNPHASEGGIFGDEEARVLAPAVAAARERGVDASGPRSPDTVFAEAASGRHDGVLALYHDQAFLPVKTLAPHGAVTLLAGLPYLRLSPSHGTAFDLAGTGRASSEGLVAALEQAIAWSANKRDAGDVVPGSQAQEVDPMWLVGTWIGALALIVAQPVPDRKPSADPQRVVLERADLEGGWRAWSLPVAEGEPESPERFTALHGGWPDGPGRGISAGTSHGRYLEGAGDGGSFLSVALGPEVEVTSVALAADYARWVGTSDGVYRLTPTVAGNWMIEHGATRYEGQPRFVSGGYLPAENGTREWGRVHALYAPRKAGGYGPFAASREHGLYVWTRYGNTWHHWLPHFFGANSAWLDTAELVPGGRPTALAEDSLGHLWIGTEGGGLVRLDARARAWHRRSPAEAVDPEELSKDDLLRLGPDQLGAEFDRVHALAASRTEGVVWALLGDADGATWVARLANGEGRATRVASNGPPRPDTRYGFAELEPETVLVGTDDGLLAFSPAWRRLEPVPGPEGQVRDVVVLEDGTVWASSSTALFERPAP